MQAKYLIAAFTLLLVVLSASPIIRSGASQRAGSYPVTVIDDSGSSVTLNEKPTRIISLAPSNTVLAYGLGLGKYLVGGVGNEYVCGTIAPLVSNLTSVGGFSGLDYSEILALKPQLILASGINSPDQIAKLKQLNLTVVVLNPTNISGIERDIILLGNLTGTQETASRIVYWMNNVLAAVKSRLPTTDTKAFYLLDTSGGYWTAGNSTFMNSMMLLAGGSNIASNITGWGTISPETILAENPRVLILDQYVNSSIVNQMPFQGIAAVKQGRVYVIPHEGWFDQPDYRIIYGIVWLAEVFHPSAMKGFTVPSCPAFTGSENVTQPVSIVAPKISSGNIELEYAVAGAIIIVLIAALLFFQFKARKQRRRGT